MSTTVVYVRIAHPDLEHSLASSTEAVVSESTSVSIPVDLTVAAKLPNADCQTGQRRR
ncbi:hypothetical protein [Rhodococcus sp. ACS1]|uniref:hypothetical protein n=1 Tax=Rhodococcus sp. ACS1 TaxID=2028570 RepID=UPI0015CCDA5F|nr:hypothetical protein [Rhodococcus sp. ACS1]